MNLPEDPNMLLSFVNMKLRDGDYRDLEDFCGSMDCDREVLISKLKEAGFDYIPEIKQFR